MANYIEGITRNSTEWQKISQNNNRIYRIKIAIAE
jgi:hypothetical protein